MVGRGYGETATSMESPRLSSIRSYKPSTCFFSFHRTLTSECDPCLAIDSYHNAGAPSTWGNSNFHNLNSTALTTGEYGDCARVTLATHPCIVSPKRVACCAHLDLPLSKMNVRGATRLVHLADGVRLSRNHPRT